MRAPIHNFLLLLLLLSVSFFLLATSSPSTSSFSLTTEFKFPKRRVLHQPLFPVISAPPPETVPPPPPESVPDEPFFPEVPPAAPTTTTATPPPPVSAVNGSVPIPAATQPAKPAKKVAIAISVGIVTLGMLSALAFFLYRHRVKTSGEGQKLYEGGEVSRRFDGEDSRAPPSTFLYVGTVEPSRSSVVEQKKSNGSPYHKLNPVKRSADRYRPSPDLQPLPPLPKPPAQFEHVDSSPPAPGSSSDEESSGTAFYTPGGSSVSNEDGFYTPVSARRTRSGGSVKSTNGKNGVNTTSNSSSSILPHSKRTSPKSRFSSSAASPEMKQVIIPPMYKPPPSPPPPPRNVAQKVRDEEFDAYVPKRPKFAAPPPPPNVALLQSISVQGSSRAPAPPPPPPPRPPPPRVLAALATGEVGSLQRARTEVATPVEQLDKGDSSLGSSNVDESGGRPKLKPLHWDKVRATSDRATVWDQIKSSSFQLNEDMMESLFGCNSVNSANRESTRRSVLPPVESENRVLDPKKSQNIAILLRALNVTRDEVSEALLDGNPESVGAELLETLVKMAPTKEEEIKLRDYHGDVSKLGSAERFLKAVLDIPFAFKRVEAMLYRANFDTEVGYLRKSFQTLEEASEELKNSRLFFKLLEAVLRTGNRMNVGTNRGDAKAFKLETLLKLVDIKGTDGKTTLLHFVVQEIIRSEGLSSDSKIENLEASTQTRPREEDFRKQGLQVVSGLGRDLGNVKKAAGMDSDVLSSYVSKLESGLEKVRLVLQYEQPDMQGNFFKSMKMFLRDADEEITRVKTDERKALALVKEVTEYFHGDAAKEEAHPLRIFMIVRDFLNILDHVCKDVGKMQDRTVVGAARSFRISSTASLPVLNRYNSTAPETSSDEESSSR